MTLMTRAVAVALSAEALLQQWARQDAAPSGAAVVADAEIAARRRGGVEWRSPHAVAVSVLARPASLAAPSADVSWAAASLAAAEALDDCLGGRRSCLWPDLVLGEPPDDVDVAITAACALGPGRVEQAVLTVRVGSVDALPQRAEFTEALLRRLRTHASSLDHASAVVDAYRARCVTLGQAVELRLLPHRTIRGQVTDIDETGQLVLCSPTGLQEHIAVAAVSTVTLLPDA